MDESGNFQKPLKITSLKQIYCTQEIPTPSNEVILSGFWKLPDSSTLQPYQGTDIRTSISLTEVVKWTNQI